jgi:hypothetical protein
VSHIDGILARVFDAVLAPLTHMPPAAGVAVLALLTSIAAALLMTFTANHHRERVALRKMHAAVLEMRLFNDDIRAVGRAAGAMLQANGLLLAGLAVPLALLAVPLYVLVTQADSLYGYTGLSTGQPAMLSVRLASLPAAMPDAGPDAVLHAPAGVRVDTPAVWFPESREIVWRLTPEAAGRYDLQGVVNGAAFTAVVDASDLVVRRPARPSPASPVDVAPRYPVRRIEVLGWPASWLTWYCGWSLLMSLGLVKGLRRFVNTPATTGANGTRRAP